MVMLPSAWVIDSNCFINMGRHGGPNLEKDLASTLSKMDAELHVTPGVHGEVATVKMTHLDGRPLLLDVLGNLLTTTPIEEDQVKGLAKRIGEKASPQDVDLSLMVLASRLAGKGEEVVLVSDDYKMTVTGERIHLPYRTCPPSTFFQRLSNFSTGGEKTRLRGMSRKIRGDEMRYAISRAGEYDIQSKLTWMVDTLLQSDTYSPRVPEESVESASDEVEMINTLRRHMMGERVKKGKLSQVSALAGPCSEVAELNGEIATIAAAMKTDESKQDLYAKLYKLGSDVIADFGLAMAPLSAEKAIIAHRAVALTLCRYETILGLMAKSCEDLSATRAHLARGLHHATLIDDDQAESRALFHLGLVELAVDSPQRAAKLFEAAATEGKRVDFMRLELNLAAAIARQLCNDNEAADVHIQTVHRMVEGNEAESIEGLSNLGETLLSIGRPTLALEVFDEALECAVESGCKAEAADLADAVSRCTASITGDEGDSLEKMRNLLDRVNSLGGEASESFFSQVEAIEEKHRQQQEPLPQTWAEWQDSAKLFGDENELEILRTVRQDNGDLMLVCYHPELGNLGIWLPDSTLETSATSRYQLDASDTRVKVATPSEEIRLKHNIRGLIAVEEADKLSLKVVSQVQ